MQQAKFLKACGTLKETPSEIRKAARRLIGSSPDEAGSDRSKFHCRLPDEATQKMQPDRPLEPPTPLKLSKMLGEDLDSQDHSPIRLNL